MSSWLLNIWGSKQPVFSTPSLHCAGHHVSWYSMLLALCPSGYPERPPLYMVIWWKTVTPFANLPFLLWTSFPVTQQNHRFLDIHILRRKISSAVHWVNFLPWCQTRSITRFLRKSWCQVRGNPILTKGRGQQGVDWRKMRGNIKRLSDGSN